MPPRYSYWTIIAGGLPTAFRAAERDELLPTFTRLREKHPDAEMKMVRAREAVGVARGGAPRHGRAARRDAGAARRFGRRVHDRALAVAAPAGDEPKRQRDWRPGGEHRDPRQKYADAKKARNLDRRREKFARKHGGEEALRGRTPRAMAAHGAYRRSTARRSTARRSTARRHSRTGAFQDRPRPPRNDWRKPPHGESEAPQRPAGPRDGSQRGPKHRPGRSGDGREARWTRQREVVTAEARLESAPRGRRPTAEARLDSAARRWRPTAEARLESAARGGDRPRSPPGLGSARAVTDRRSPPGLGSARAATGRRSPPGPAARGRRTARRSRPGISGQRAVTDVRSPDESAARRRCSRADASMESGARGRPAPRAQTTAKARAGDRGPAASSLAKTTGRVKTRRPRSRGARQPPRWAALRDRREGPGSAAPRSWDQRDGGRDRSNRCREPPREDRG